MYLYNSMNEIPKFISAEKAYILKPESLEIEALIFAKDPISVLAKLRADFAPEVTDDLTDPVQNPAGAASLIMASFCDYISEVEIETPNKNLQDFIKYGPYTAEGDKAWLELFKAAGYSRAEVDEWVGHMPKDISTVDMFVIKRTKALVSKIYGT